MKRLRQTQFRHQITPSSGIQSSSYTTFCLKLSIENLVSNQAGFQFDDNSVLCVNLFLLKENLADSYYLCENAFFPISKITALDQGNSNTDLSNTGLASTHFSHKNYVEKCALFCDISEKVCYKMLLLEQN